MKPLLDQIKKWAGPQRAQTFVSAAEFITAKCKRPTTLIETGCYRGADCDGMSTLILACLAKETGGWFLSYELNQDHVDAARAMLSKHGVDAYAAFVCGDSARTLYGCPDNVSFAYLDSYDYEAHAPHRCQMHQLAEAALVLPKMAPVSGFLLDDASLPKGGKTALSTPAIQACGYRIVESAYQRLLLRP